MSLLTAPFRKAANAVRLIRAVLKAVGLRAEPSLVDALVLNRAILVARRRSFLEPAGLFSLDRLTRGLDARGVAGDIVECGVFRGGSASVIGRAMRGSPFRRELWLFDSFAGLPKPTDADGAEAREYEGQLVSSQDEVRRFLTRMHVPMERVHIHAGWFQDTFPQAQVGKIALLHIDADWYDSILLCFERFYDQVEPGGVVVLDDYGEWPGCKTALEDFTRRRGITVELQFPGPGTAPYFFKR